MKDLNIIFETKFGSHIYGTSTPASDLDFKGLYLAPYEDIILNKVKDSIVLTSRQNKAEGVRNTKDDVDREYKELRRFLEDAISGQTYALDMLYTPSRFWLQNSTIWTQITEQRHRFLSKSMNAFIGYIRQQTGKYAMKGTRMEAVLTTVEYLRRVDPNIMLLAVWDNIPKGDFVKLVDHVSLVNKEPHTEIMLSVLEKKFQKNVKVKFVLDNLEKFYDEYGGRSRMAMENQGVDWKAVSHAYRACYQMLDIANEGEIIFPLKQAAYVLKVKSGEVNYKDVVQEELPELMERAIDAIDKSYLPDKVDRSYWDDFILKTYANPTYHEQSKNISRKCSNCGDRMKVERYANYNVMMYCDGCRKPLDA